MEMPEVPFPSARVLETAGADGLRRLVRHHHGLLRHSPIGHLFAADEAEFAALVERIADYVVEVCGGPALFTPLHGNTCMRTRHFPFSIDERGREIWLEKLLQAIDETAFPAELHEEYWAWMEPFTIRMINRRTTKAQPIRLPYAQARQRFAPPAQA
jgi:hemoglobin